MASEKVQTLTDGNFEQTINGGKVVLVDFWAEWCGPCRRMSPTVDQLATDYDGKMVVAKMNVDENPYTPNRFSVRGIPTLLLFKGGQVVEQVVGLTDKDSLKKVIDKHVAAQSGDGGRVTEVGSQTTAAPTTDSRQPAAQPTTKPTAENG
jgi:thioredoxin 1